jgi:hexosaminidase
VLPEPRRWAQRGPSLPLGQGVRLLLPAAPVEALASALVRQQARLDAALGRGREPYPLALELDSTAVGVGPEAYTLELAESAGRLAAPTNAGLLAGLERALQWLLGATPPTCLRVEDAPANAWRGLLLDPARHPLGEAALLRTLDGMAALGLNVLHLHLSDDQGLRFESRRRPRVTLASGSEGYLTADAIGRLVQEARARAIRIVPELDLPGHAGALLFAYPECAAGAVPKALPRAFGPSAYALDPTRFETWGLLNDLLEDLAELFPDPYLHLGGDEVPSAIYAFPDAKRQAWCAARGISPGPEVQQWFSRALSELCRERGKRLILWDEALHPELPPEVTVQVWRRVETAAEAVAQGHEVILSSPYYLDLAYRAARHLPFQPQSGASALAAAQQALLAAPELADVRKGVERVMALADDVRTQAGGETGRVLGGEACLWGELVDEAVLDGRLYGRLPAVAEALWRDGAVPSEASHYDRLGPFLAYLERTTACEPRPALRACQALGLPLVQAAQLRVFFDALVPKRWYKRLLGQGLDGRLRGEVAVQRPRDARTPLTAPVDFLPVESLALRALAGQPGSAPAWAAQGVAWLQALDALAPALAPEGALSAFAAHGRALACLAEALVAQDGRWRTLAEAFEGLEAGEAVFAVPALLLGRPSP